MVLRLLVTDVVDKSTALPPFLRTDKNLGGAWPALDHEMFRNQRVTYSPVVVVELIGFIQIRGWREGGFMPKGTVIGLKAKTNLYSPYLTRKLNFVGNIIIHKKYNVTQTDRNLTAYN